MNEELGDKIKKFRKARCLTLKEPGEQVGLSISYLSLVERGLGSIDTVSLQAGDREMSQGIPVLLFGRRCRGKRPGVHISRL